MRDPLARAIADRATLVMFALLSRKALLRVGRRRSSKDLRAARLRPGCIEERAKDAACRARPLAQRLVDGTDVHDPRNGHTQAMTLRDLRDEHGATPRGGGRNRVAE